MKIPKEGPHPAGCEQRPVPGPHREAARVPGLGRQKLRALLLQPGVRGFHPN